MEQSLVMRFKPNHGDLEVGLRPWRPTLRLPSLLKTCFALCLFAGLSGNATADEPPKENGNSIRGQDILLACMTHYEEQCMALRDSYVRLSESDESTTVYRFSDGFALMQLKTRHPTLPTQVRMINDKYYAIIEEVGGNWKQRIVINREAPNFVENLPLNLSLNYWQEGPLIDIVTGDRFRPIDANDMPNGNLRFAFSQVKPHWPMKGLDYVWLEVDPDERLLTSWGFEADRSTISVKKRFEEFTTEQPFRLPRRVVHEFREFDISSEKVIQLEYGNNSDLRPEDCFLSHYDLPEPWQSGAKAASAARSQMYYIISLMVLLGFVTFGAGAWRIASHRKMLRNKKRLPS